MLEICIHHYDIIALLLYNFALSQHLRGSMQVCMPGLALLIIFTIGKYHAAAN